MRVGIYFSPLRSVHQPTGVGQHMMQMLAGLASSDQVEASLLTHQAAHDALTTRLPEMPLHPLSGNERRTRWLQLATGLRPIDRDLPDLDWVYCPKEQPVAVRHAKLAVTVHDVLPFEPGLGRLRGGGPSYWLRWRITMRRILSRARLIAVVSEFSRQRMLQMFGARRGQRTRVVGNGVDPAYFRRAAPEDAELLERHGVEARRYLLAVGGITARKGADLLLGLADQLDGEAETPVQSILVSGQRHTPELLAAAEVRGRESHGCPVTPIGYVPVEDLAVLLSNAFALVLPSYYEGFGMPVIEAMAAGTPVICSDAGALPEVAGEAGLVVPQGKVPPLLDAVRQLSASTGFWESRAEAGVAHAAEFTWDRCVKRLIDAMAEDL